MKFFAPAAHTNEGVWVIKSMKKINNKYKKLYRNTMNNNNQLHVWPFPYGINTPFNSELLFTSTQIQCNISLQHSPILTAAHQIFLLLFPFCKKCRTGELPHLI